MHTKEQEGQVVLNFAAASFRKRMAGFRLQFAKTSEEAQAKLGEISSAASKIIDTNQRIRANWKVAPKKAAPVRHLHSVKE